MDRVRLSNMPLTPLIPERRQRHRGAQKIMPESADSEQARQRKGPNGRAFGLYSGTANGSRRGMPLRELFTGKEAPYAIQQSVWPTPLQTSTQRQLQSSSPVDDSKIRLNASLKQLIGKKKQKRFNATSGELRKKRKCMPRLTSQPVTSSSCFHRSC